MKRIIQYAAAVISALLLSPVSVAFGLESVSSPTEMNVEILSEQEESWSLDSLSVSRASDGGAPVLGVPERVSASASGDTGHLTYKFVWTTPGWSRWGVISGPSASSECTWTPEVAGDVSIYVDVTDSAGRTVTRSWRVGVPAAEVSIGGGARQKFGDDPVRISSRGAEGSLYKFVWATPDWSRWGVICKASGSSSCEWKAPCSGDYRIYVDVIAPDGSCATSTAPLSLEESWSLDSLSVSRASDGGAPVLGVPERVSASASGDTGHLTYKFVWTTPGWSRWGVISGPSASSECTWTPEVAGDVSIYVDVTDSAGRTVTRSWPVKVSYNISSIKDIKIAADGSALKVGKPLSITAGVDAFDSSALSYKFVWERNNWSDWGVISPSSPNSVCQWVPPVSGDLNIYVDVIDSDGHVTTSHVPCHIDSEEFEYNDLRPDSDFIHLGDSVDISANVSGESQFLTYKFVWEKNGWKSWGVAQSGFKNILKWKPSEPGDYTIYCDVIASNGSAITKTVQVHVWSYVKATAISTDGNKSWSIRADMGSLEAERNRGFTFKFVWAKPDWSQWGVLRDTSYVNDAYFNPATRGLPSGYYNMYVDVTFPDGTVQTKTVSLYFNPTGTNTVLDVSRVALVNWLSNNQYNGYYLGTRYSSGFTEDTCLYPNGQPRWDGFTGMNCTGFVAHAYRAVGGNLAAIAANNNHSPWGSGPGGGGAINAWRWYGYAVDSGCKMYEFRTVADMLASGVAQKGDIIFFKTNGSIDCHIGFFWGDNSHENKMWHQILPGNLIGPCFNNANKGEVNQTVVLIK